jgi:hypothetical protein
MNWNSGYAAIPSGIAGREYPGLIRDTIFQGKRVDLLPTGHSRNRRKGQIHEITQSKNGRRNQ